MPDLQILPACGGSKRRDPLPNPSHRLRGTGNFLFVAQNIKTIAVPTFKNTTTRYELDGRELVARAGPFRWRVDLATVQSVTPSRNPLSSPALSLDRLDVRHGDGRCLLISPADRDRFLAALARAEPALERHGDALRRRG